MSEKYDFSGWATRNNLRCSDGRTIRQNAFIDNDGKTVPLVWQHQHDSPANVLGHALLENREDGVYAYCKFNDSELAQHAKELVSHKDITSLSIYANQLKQDGGNVLHGVIREVSLVLAGANPGAFIEYTSITHGDGELEEANIYNDEEELTLEHGCGKKEEKIQNGDSLEHEKEEPEAPMEEKKNEKTVKDVFDELTEEQKQVVYFMIGQAVEDAGNNTDKKEEEETPEMKHNVFESDTQNNTLSHADMAAVFADAKRFGSLKESFLQHNGADAVLMHAEESGEYGITDIENFYPGARATGAPDFIKRPTDWVSIVMNGVKRTPFSRIKSMHANITADEARAKGYVKGNQKISEVIVALKRETTPTTVYKHQALDRDDILDITDFDVVAWLKNEMRMMLDEELARAILIGDQRTALDNDKINESCIRPIYTDDETYAVHVSYAPDYSQDTPSDIAHEFIRTCIKSRKNYHGSGNPILFTTEDMLTECLLMEDLNGRVIYDSEEKLATALRVSKIVTVPVMEGVGRSVDGDNYEVRGIIVNLNDYNVGADKGGSVNMFDDFDIDYNQQKYLIETRCSGALIKPKSAIVIEEEVGA